MLSVVIPVFNERATIPIVLKRVKNVPLEKEIIIVDDGSIDGTREYLGSLSEPGIRVILSEKNLGKGSAVREGFKHATGDIVIIQDADLEYHPEEYLELIKPILDGRADVVYGSRFIGAHRVFLFSHYIGNKVVNFIANILYNTNLTDMMTGYKAFRGDVIKNLSLEARGFGIEAEITAEIFKHQLKVYEVPISYSGRAYDEGKKISWYHFFVVLYWLMRQKVIVKDIPLHILFEMSHMRNYNRWLLSLMKDFIGRNILEVGSGIGNIAKYFLSSEQLVLTDVNEQNILYLRNYFHEYPNIKILRHDITASSQDVLKDFKFDTILCLNVLEHMEDDRKVLGNIYNLMGENTRFLIVVPAFSSLMGSFDYALGHHRRYAKEGLSALLDSSNLAVEKIQYLNFLGALGWFVNSKILRRKTSSQLQLWFYEKLFWLIRLERFFNLPFGLTLFAVCKKKQNYK